MDCLKYLNFPIMLGAVDALPPATPINYALSVVIGFIFNYVIRRRRFGWWCKYNCELNFTIPEDAHFYGSLAGIDVLSAGLDAGYAIGFIIIFFALLYPKNGTIGQDTIQMWWGNVVYTNTADYKGVPYKTVPNGGTFGPSSW
jgi:hypothetical protein